MNTANKYCWTIRLDKQAFDYGNKFASQQSDVDKANLVRLNTLAVYAVNEFVQEELGYTTDLKAGESWNPVVRMVHNVADLVIPDLGIIECRVMQAGDEVINLPIEVQENRIAYVVVEFTDDLQKAKLRGFSSTHDLGCLRVSQLQPIEELVDCLFKLESSQFSEEASIIEVVKEELENAPESVQEILKNQSLEEIVRRLEDVYHNYSANDWWDEGGRCLANSLAGVGEAIREINELVDASEVENVEIELRDFAEDLLEKLAEFWEDDA